MKTSLYFLLFSACLLLSCRKQIVTCIGNCYSLSVNGKVVNSLTNENASNVPLVISQVKFIGLVSSSKTVQEFNSKNDGTFSTAPSIDSTMFNDGYFLSLKVKDNKNYITLPDRGNNRLYNLSTNTLSNLTISVFPKASLTIKLNRVQNDDFQYFSVAYYFIDNQAFYGLNVLSPQDVTQKELNVFTSADLFTKILVTKRNSSGITTATLDSIKCLKNQNNTYTVNY